MGFGAWLAERRRLAGMTQRQLAKKCGLSAGYIALLERGTAEPPPLDTCKRMARALGLSREEVRQRKAICEFLRLTLSKSSQESSLRAASASVSEHF